MAFESDASGDQARKTSAGSVPAYPFTFACWVMRTRETPGFEGIVSIDSDANSDYFGLWQTNTPRFELFAADGSFRTAQAPTTLSADTWYHVICEFKSATSRTIYLDDDSGTEDTTSCSPSTQTAIGIFNIYDASPSNSFMGKIAELGIWQHAVAADVLIAEERTALATGASPLLVRPGELQHYYPCYDDSDPVDLIGGDHMTTAGTPVAAEHPPGVFYPAWPMYKAGIAAAAPAGALPAGSLTTLGVGI